MASQTESEAVRFKLVTLPTLSLSQFWKDPGFSDSFDSVLRNFTAFSFLRNLSVTLLPYFCPRIQHKAYIKVKGIKVMKRLLPLLIFGAAALQAGARTVRGKIRDARTGEEIIGARVEVKGNPASAVVSGLDGSFNLNYGQNSFTLICTYMGYQPFEVQVREGSGNIEIPLVCKEIELKSVTVTAHNPGRSEAGARLMEKNAMSVVNVMSAKAIELSPDITVGDVIRRMSGVTVERGDGGEGQYAILRGMDKRYNYTLVNGAKISSPDNKNRFVPLDIFPSEMLDRLEVTKSLTADMEGDGIGGAVDLVMKDAPMQRQFTANVSTGYNSMYFDRDFKSFAWDKINKESPDERLGTTRTGSRMDASMFDPAVLHLTERAPLPDISAGLSYGDRFAGERLGVMLAASFQNTSRGRESDISWNPGTTLYGTEHRDYSVRQTRTGAHLKLDYHVNGTNKLTWYNGYMDLREGEVRDGADDRDRKVRLKWNHQYIFNSTLKGEHKFLKDGALMLDWTAGGSRAFNETPDYVKMEFNGRRVYSQNSAERSWEHNSDRDLSAAANLAYKLKMTAGQSIDFKVGGLYRDKKRESFYNSYTFNSETGYDWENFDDIEFTPRRRYGNIGDPLNYDATERIGAAYVMLKYARPLWEINVGLRAEHTDQGYKLLFPEDNSDPEGHQKYWDWLPSAHFKYNVHENANLRFSYYRAVNRPSFFEIAPYDLVGEDYNEAGNPDLNHTVADNLDLRYEFFPRTSEQFMVGVFYKNIQDPIEYGLVLEGQDLTYMPMNLGTATNLGVEVDIMKYFSWFGVKANYTYTHSSITSEKMKMQGNDVVMTEQTRPLYGQAAHVANLSLLFKSRKHAWEGQVLGTYTGKRLADISQWEDDDIWEKGFFQLDASLEKGFRFGLTLFAKASNLLDTPLLRYIHKGPHTVNVTSRRDNGHVVERESWSGRNFMIGIRYKL